MLIKQSGGKMSKLLLQEAIFPKRKDYSRQFVYVKEKDKDEMQIQDEKIEMNMRRSGKYANKYRCSRKIFKGFSGFSYSYCSILLFQLVGIFGT